MKKKKVTAKKLMPAIFTVAVCACTVAGLGAASYLEGKPQKFINENGESFISVYNKADIVGNIYEQQGKLVILEIVPYENAGIMEMLTGSERVVNILDSKKAELYQEFKSTEVDYGDVTTVTVGGSISSYHPFTIDYEVSTGEYTLNYSNKFLNNLVDSLDNTDIYRYLADNIEVRTVVASELTEEDLEGASLIYLSSYVENEEVVNFNRYINGEIGTSRLNMNLGNEQTGAYAKNGSNYTPITVKDSSTAEYNSYIINADGEYVSSDISWDMVEYIIDYVYAGNEYTDGQPVPCIVDYGINASVDTNAHKLANLLLKTSADETAEFNGVSTYYKNVMADIVDGTYTYNGKSYTVWDDTSVPLFNITSAKANDYVLNNVYKTDNTVDSMMFLMGSPFNFEETITDNNSAAVRDITAAGEAYTSTAAIRYLLNGGGEEKSSNRVVDRAVDADSVVFRVLEIEPCLDFDYDYSKATTDSKKKEVFQNIKALGQALGIASYDKLSSYSQYEALTNKRIEFKSISTNEFNGMNEDLVAFYDIIIIGTNTGMMNTDSSGNTIFNDDELDGYIYLAYGDLVKGQDWLLGYLPSDYKILNTSAVTNKAGYTYEQKDLTRLSTTTNWKSQKIIYSMYNKKIWSPLLYNSLDRSQYWVYDNIYTYRNWSNRAEYYADSKANTRLTGNDITDKKLNELLEFVNINRPVVIEDALYNCPSESGNKTAYPTSNVYSFVKQVTSNDTVIKSTEIAAKLTTAVHDNILEIQSYTMEYEKNGTRYTAPEIDYDTSTGLLKESCIVDGVEEFKYTVTFKAEPGKRYFVKAIIDKNTDGRFKSEATIDDFNEVYYAKIITAKESTVTENLNIKLADGYNGMFAWKILIEELNGSNVAVDAVSEQGYTVVRGDTKKVNALQITPNGTLLDMSQTNTTFGKLLKESTQLINYDVTITSITADNFEKLFVSKPYTKGTSYNTDANQLKKYNMVIFGFKDSWGGEDISDDYGALSCIVDYIENGNSVLMAHDVLTFFNSANYNITVNSGGGIYAKVQKNGSFCLSLQLRELIGMDVYGVSTIGDLSDATLEAAGVPKKSDGTFIREIQGFTDWHIYRYNQRQIYKSTKTTDVTTLAPYKGAESYMPQNGSEDPDATDVMVTTIVDEVNRGQISMYPFNTTTSDGTLTVGQTHPQYYRLDLEDDELVVWYTLGYSSGKNYSKFYRDGGKDAANNYYIYSKGNITYTGAGHADMSVQSELKLFVNTTIRAATAGNFTPSITITNGASTNDPNLFVVFPSVLDKDIVVQFEAFDEDLATREVVQDTYPGDEEAIKNHIGRFQSGAIYYVDPITGEEKVLIEYNRTTGPYLLNGEPTELIIYNPYASYPSSQWESLANSETDQKKKNMYECYIQYMQGGLVDLVVEAADYAGATGRSNVQVVQQELFPLD